MTYVYFKAQSFQLFLIQQINLQTHNCGMVVFVQFLKIFSINKYLKGDAKNITYLLYKMAVFIRQRKLEDKIAKDIPQIVEFGFAAQNILSSIYKSEQDKLTANKKSKTFRQCIAVQFNSKVSKNQLNINQSSPGTGKQASISRIPPPIPSRLSKSVLAKSKFYKTNSSSSMSLKPIGQFYTQAFQENIKDIVKIKENFLNLSA